MTVYKLELSIGCDSIIGNDVIDEFIDSISDEVIPLRGPHLSQSLFAGRVQTGVSAKTTSVSAQHGLYSSVAA